MTDGNTYAINKHLDDQEDWDALQEVTAELEQAEARIEEMELAVRYEADLAQMALDARKELETKLTKALEFIEDLTGCEWPYCEDAKRALAELKGQDDGC
jgi:hypothetical protein